MSRLRSAAPYLVALALMTAGWANLVRGAAHPGVPYRQWAFDHHAYSDLLAMAGDRYFHGGRPIPYVEDRVEYPPLLAAALWLPSFVSRTPWAYFTASAAALAALALASVWMLRRIPGASAWWFAGSPALAYYSALNWDHLPIALVLAAVLAHARGRLATAGAWAGLGAAAKLFPIALVPPALGALTGARAWRGLAIAAAGFVAAFAAVNLPVALAAPKAWTWFWTFNAGRGAENSAWELLRHTRLKWVVFDAPLLNALGLLLLGAAALYAAACAWHAARPEAARAGDPRRAVRLGLALLLVAWVTTNKVYSPQYALYVLVAGALVAAPRALAVLVSATAVVDYHVAFESRASRGLVRYFDPLYSAEEAARTVVFLALLAWIAREAWRAAVAVRAEPRERSAAP
jgi:uncharacterized membrane protein